MIILININLIKIRIQSILDERWEKNDETSEKDGEEHLNSFRKQFMLEEIEKYKI